MDKFIQKFDTLNITIIQDRNSTSGTCNYNKSDPRKPIHTKSTTNNSENLLKIYNNDSWFPYNSSKYSTINKV